MAYSGITAQLKIGDEKLAYVSNFSVEETRDVIEITELGSKSKAKKPALYSWTASADGVADFENDGAQKTLRDAMLNGTEVTAVFYLCATAGKLTYLTGTAYVESLSVDISAEDKGNISISLTGSGELKLVQPQKPDDGAENEQPQA